MVTQCPWYEDIDETMDSAIDQSYSEKALDLANIRFQLMYGMPLRRPDPGLSLTGHVVVVSKTASPST